jgi:(1->4)-alpha-D-glucan 1-alpha-D-glucosylmutase
MADEVNVTGGMSMTGDVQGMPPADVLAAADLIVSRLREQISQEPRPRATYRWQFHHGFTFHDAAKLTPYLQSLGVSHVYASPYLKARAGSMHGYEIVDHSLLNPELGGDEGFAGFVAAMRQHGLGQILDVVPNHMGVGSDENPWWQDVLENGPSSPFASCFDIDWQPLKPDLDNKVLLPVLGDQFGKVLEDGQLVLHFADGTFSLSYFGRRFPVAPRSYGQVLRHRMAELEQSLGGDHPAVLEYHSILTAIGHLPPREETEPDKLTERNREKEIIKRRLGRLCADEPQVADFIAHNVTIFNGQRGEPSSFDLLDTLLQDQAYRLSFWRVASDEINYRRFFDVNELAAVCMEHSDVFDKAHALVLRLLDEGQIDGLRIDHADGLFDPTAYLWQLQERRFLQRCRQLFEEAAAKRDPLDTASERDPLDTAAHRDPGGTAESAPPVWEAIEPALRGIFANIQSGQRNDPVARLLYLVVEKILEGSERLPDDWPIHGTSGYEFLNQVNLLFIDRANAKAFDSLYAKFIGERINFSELVCRSKKLIMKVSMSSELNVLGHQLDRISEHRRASRDFTRSGLTYALREVVSCFPVYRTYTTPAGVLDRDRRYVEQAVARAKRQNPAISPALFDFIRDVLLLADADNLTDAERNERLQFIGRFQQFTGPVMAKSVEDTSYYNYNRLVSLNEVGSDPDHFGDTVATFHRLNQERQAAQPFAMLATSTHDTKRSEDFRARVNVLSELPREWKEHLTLWTRWNKRKKTKLDGDLAPGRNDEYLLYQTLLGTWPFEPPGGAALETYISRIQHYMTKAMREAKTRTSWIAPNEAYERATHEFIASILGNEPLSAFRTDFEPFAARISRLGMWNSLSQTLLKLTSPGVPDTYQGMEQWEFTLVDPDNRQPVDYAGRQQTLQELDRRAAAGNELATLADDLVSHAEDGRIKLFLTATTLRLRCAMPALFTTGDYIPLEIRGTGSQHVCAFARLSGDRACVVVVPRLVGTLIGSSDAAPVGSDIWKDTTIQLPPRIAPLHWRDVFTGQAQSACASGELAMSDVLKQFPVSLLVAGT